MAEEKDTISGRGVSAKWTSNQSNVIRIFNLFRLSNPVVTNLLPLPWDELTEDLLCTNEKDVYGKFAHYLINVYIIDSGEYKGQPLRVDPATNYLSTALNLAKAKFLSSGTSATKLFFTCLNPKAGTFESQWLLGVKKEINRLCFQRTMQAGEELDNSETPLYLELFRLMNRAYSREGSIEAADRKFILTSLWDSGGRSSEVVFCV
jgi:hypothetical protein